MSTKKDPYYEMEVLRGKYDLLRFMHDDLRVASNRLQEYLTAKVGPIEDIPDEVWGPFCDALKEASK
jgi:hypothetical protein